MGDQIKRAMRSPSSITLGSLIAAFMTLAAVYQAAPAIGMDLPRWAWYGELQETEARVAGLFRPVASERIEEIRQELRTLELAIEQLQAQGAEPPGWMVRDQVALELQLKRWQDLQQQVNQITR